MVDLISEIKMPLSNDADIINKKDLFEAIKENINLIIGDYKKDIITNQIINNDKLSIVELEDIISIADMEGMDGLNDSIAVHNSTANSSPVERSGYYQTFEWKADDDLLSAYGKAPTEDQLELIKEAAGDEPFGMNGAGTFRAALTPDNKNMVIADALSSRIESFIENNPQGLNKQPAINEIKQLVEFLS